MNIENSSQCAMSLILIYIFELNLKYFVPDLALLVEIQVLVN